MVSAAGIIFSSSFGAAAQAQTDPAPSLPDSIVAEVAASQGLVRLAPEEVPAFGTFWTVQNPCPYAFLPVPFAPLDPTLPVYSLENGKILVDATGGQVIWSRRVGVNAPSQAEAAAVLQVQTEAVLD